MFLGHFAVALGAKKAAPDLNLGLTIAAAQGLDLLWPMLVLAGVERVVVEPGNTVVSPLNFATYPYSHSLGMAALWGLAVGLLALGRGLGRRAGAVLGVLVLSHWFLDLLVHRPDLQLYPGSSQHVGLGLWNSLPLTLALEFGSLVVGAWLYLRVTRPVGRAGTWAILSLLAFLALVYLGSVFGPPPPSGQAVALVALSMWLLVAWGAWADSRRTAAA
jgi:hypothetical protein